jgi:HrpA-like RNA helicase
MGHQQKIILSTNIAETSVTIPNVRHMIDTGFANRMFYYPDINSNELPTTRILKACADQRAGRGGRTGDTTAYRLYTQTDFDEFSEFPIPETMQSSLVELNFYGKIMTDSKTNEFWKKAISPPPAENISKGVEILKKMKVFDETENLTRLGKMLINIPLKIKYRKMVLYALILRTLDPVLNLVSILSLEDAFQGRLEACSTCSKHTGAEGATTVNKAPNTIGNGAKRQMNTVKFWLEPALTHSNSQHRVMKIANNLNLEKCWLMKLGATTW